MKIKRQGRWLIKKRGKKVLHFLPSLQEKKVDPLFPDYFAKVGLIGFLFRKAAKLSGFFKRRMEGGGRKKKNLFRTVKSKCKDVRNVSVLCGWLCIS